MTKTAILVMNTGTPCEPTSQAVKRYLREFLSDPLVMTMPSVVRYFLLHGVILRKRPKIVAPRYRSIWTDEGSPHLSNSIKLVEKLNTKSNDSYKAFVAMRYGLPSTSSAISQALSEGFERFLIAPMFPQYAKATNGTCIKHAIKEIQKAKKGIEFKVLPSFHMDERYISAQVELCKQMERRDANHHILFAFHGLPMSQIRKIHPRSKSMSNLRPCKDNCEAETDCYSKQCEETAAEIAKQLNLQPSEWSLSYQSRLGGGKWTAPYTIEHIGELINKGVDNITVIAPGYYLHIPW